jgi:phage terminase small subunit
MTERKPVDWAAIRTEYEGTTRPVSAIGRDHEISHTAINKRAATDGWFNPRKAPKQSAPVVSKGQKKQVSKPRPETSSETTIETDEPGDGLTTRERLFIAEYLIDLNGTQAAIRAGYSVNGASQRASALLAIGKIRAAVDAALDERFEDLELTRKQVIRELRRVGLSDMRRVAKWDGTSLTLKNSGDITDDAAASVSEVSETKDGFKIKLHPKLPALVKLAEHVGVGRAPDGEKDAEAYSAAERLRNAQREIEEMTVGAPDEAVGEA